MSQMVKSNEEESWKVVQIKEKQNPQLVKELGPQRTSRSGRNITSAKCDSTGCTVRDCKSEAVDDKKVKCIVNTCRR
jgi:hypothetical protein